MYLLAVVLALSCAPTSTASAPVSMTATPITVSQGWSRATPPGAPNGAGYLIISNSGAADRLIGVTTAVAARAEVHEMSMKGGVMSMRALPMGIDIPAHGAVKLAPGGLHLMLLDLTRPLVEGERIAVTLRFEHAGEVSLELRVMPLGARGPPS